MIAEPFHIDGFAGGGGASEGYELATGYPVNVALNHDREAVAMHRMNHPFTHHECEDIRKADPVKLCGGRQPTSAWFSPDCKDFSKAKGGKPKSKRIRGLAWTVIHWVNKVRPLVIFLENVEEFREWSPLLADGRRNPALLGWFFQCFVGALRRRGYVVEWREMRACERSAAPTIRKRLYLVARCDGLPIVFPEITRAPRSSPLVTSGARKPEGIAAECIDFSVPCPSIFLNKREARKLRVKRPLVKASCERLAKGIERYVMTAAEPFIVNLTHQGNDGVESLAEPFKTVTGANRGEKALVSPLLAYSQHGGAVRGAEQPMHTITASPKDVNSVIGAILVPRYGERDGQKPRARPVNAPLPTITTTDNGGRLGAVFLAQNNTGMIGHDVREPVSTILGRGTNQAVVAAGLVPYYGSEKDTASVTDALRTVTTRDRFGYAQATVRAPLMTAEMAESARRVTRFLRRHGVAVAGEFAMCGEFVIVDIGMRMLTPRELYRAQGFGDDYIIDRGMDVDEETGELREIALTKTAQVRMCGNSVCPPMACELIRANLPHYALKEIAA